MGVENIITFDAHDPRVQNSIPLKGFVIDRLRTLTRQEIQKVRFVFAPTHPVLAALDYRSNDLFRYTFGSEDQLSNKILIAFLSDLLGIRIVRLKIRESEPVKANEGEKAVSYTHLDVYKRQHQDSPAFD